MTDAALAASLAGSLAWPAVVAGVVIGFRKPLTKLIGRVKSAEVAGQKFKFGPQLEEAEDKSAAAFSDAPAQPAADEASSLGVFSRVFRQFNRYDLWTTIPEPRDETVAPTPFEQGEMARQATNALAREAEANPSFTIIQAWDSLSQILFSYKDVVLPREQRGRSSLASWLQEMEKQKEVTPSFVEAVKDVRRLRNAVAHGEHNPTPGEAVAYVDTVSKLAYVAALQRALYEEAHTTAAAASAQGPATSSEAEPSGDGAQT